MQLLAVDFGVEPDGILAAGELIDNVESLVKRDRNHPSVIWWSLCNEIGCVARTEQEELTRKPSSSPHHNLIPQVYVSERLLVLPGGKDAIVAVKALDPTRPVTGAVNFGAQDYCTEDCLSSELDVEGFNYNFQDWLGYHKNHSSQPLISSECGRGASTRGIYETDDARGWKDVVHTQAISKLNLTRRGVSERLVVVQYESAGMSSDGELSGYPKTWEEIDGDNYIAGGFYWTGYDYKGEPAYDININSQFGILDIAGFPKDSCE